MAMGALYVANRARKLATADEVVQSVLLMAKSVTVILCMLLDSRVAAWYAVLFLGALCRLRTALPVPHFARSVLSRHEAAVLFLALKRPEYRITDALALNPSTFDSVVANGDPSITWLVFFYARWSGRCVNLLPALGSLARRSAPSDQPTLRLPSSLRASLRQVQDHQAALRHSGPCTVAGAGRAVHDRHLWHLLAAAHPRCV